MATILSRKPGGAGGGGGPPSGAAGGDLSGTYPNPDIAAGAVGTTELANDAVTAAKIGAGEVGSSEIATNAVGSDELADNAVDTNAIANNAVTAAKVAADVATQAELDAAALLLTPISGWVDDSAATWTRTANQTFTVTGDRTAVFQKGTRLRWTQTTVKYGVVVLSAHAAGTTTVTIATNTDYVLTAAAITSNSYSYAASPQGYPTWFTFVPANETGWSTANPWTTARFQIIGSTCTVQVYATGTSDATTTTFDAPVATIDTAPLYAMPTQNNGGTFVVSRVYFSSAVQLTCGVSMALDTFTASGTKSVSLNYLTYAF